MVLPSGSKEPEGFPFHPGSIRFHGHSLRENPRRVTLTGPRKSKRFQEADQRGAIGGGHSEEGLF